MPHERVVVEGASVREVLASKGCTRQLSQGCAHRTRIALGRRLDHHQSLAMNPSLDRVALFQEPTLEDRCVDVTVQEGGVSELIARDIAAHHAIIPDMAGRTSLVVASTSRRF